MIPSRVEAGVQAADHAEGKIRHLALLKNCDPSGIRMLGSAVCADSYLAR